MSESIDLFYSENKNFLDQNYPGLNNLVFKNEFLEFIDSGGNIDLFKSLTRLGIPFPYLKNKTYFYKSSFLINSGCFIPRFETEILVDLALDYIEKDCALKNEIRLADVCCGIGSIVLSIMQNSQKKISAIGIDKDELALYYTILNYYHLRFRINPQSKLDIKLADRLQIEETNFDLIVTNPPYLKNGDKIDRSAAFSPSDALYVKNYEYWFDRFFLDIYDKLTDGGMFIMEGDEAYLSEVKDIASRFFNSLTVVKDYTNRQRFIIGRKQNG